MKRYIAISMLLAAAALQHPFFAPLPAGEQAAIWLGISTCLLFFCLFCGEVWEKWRGYRERVERIRRLLERLGREGGGEDG